jgi:hypothetical protein
MAKRKNIAKTVQATEDVPFDPADVTPEDRRRFERMADQEDDGNWRTKWRITLKQKRWAEAYVGEARGNGTQAARLAGFSDDSEKYLGVVGARMVGNDRVRRYVAYLLARGRGGPREVLAGIVELSTITADAFLSFDDKGNVRTDLDKARRLAALGAIKEIQCDPETGALTRVRLYDRQKAQLMLAKMHGQIVEKVEVEDVTPGQSAMGKLLGDPEAMKLARRLAARIGAGDEGGNGHARN